MGFTNRNGATYQSRARPSPLGVLVDIPVVEGRRGIGTLPALVTCRCYWTAARAPSKNVRQRSLTVPSSTTRRSAAASRPKRAAISATSSAVVWDDSAAPGRLPFLYARLGSKLLRAAELCWVCHLASWAVTDWRKAMGQVEVELV